MARADASPRSSRARVQPAGPNGSDALEQRLRLAHEHLESPRRARFPHRARPRPRDDVLQRVVRSGAALRARSGRGDSEAWPRAKQTPRTAAIRYGATSRVQSRRRCDPHPGPRLRRPLVRRNPLDRIARNDVRRCGLRGRHHLPAGYRGHNVGPPRSVSSHRRQRVAITARATSPPRKRPEHRRGRALVARLRRRRSRPPFAVARSR